MESNQELSKINKGLDIIKQPFQCKMERDTGKGKYN